MSNHPLEIFPDLRKVAHDLRNKLESKDYIFFFAHNNAGKTRLSMEFKSKRAARTLFISMLLPKTFFVGLTMMRTVIICKIYFL